MAADHVCSATHVLNEIHDRDGGRIFVTHEPLEIRIEWTPPELPDLIKWTWEDIDREAHGAKPVIMYYLVCHMFPSWNCWGLWPADAFRSFGERFGKYWDKVAQAPDDSLNEEALELKQTLLALVAEVRTREESNAEDSAGG